MIYAENILICITVPLAISLWFVRGSARRFVISFLVGMIMCLTGAYIGGFVDSVTEMSTNDVSVFISPMVEEVTKFTPLLIYVLFVEPKEEKMFVVATGVGAGFATFENCCHILASGADNYMFILIRGFSTGIMHIVSILTVVIGIVFVRRFRAVSIAGVIGALSLAMTFHGLYNLLVSEPGVTSYIGYALPLTTSVVLYSGYMRFKPDVSEL